MSNEIHQIAKRKTPTAISWEDWAPWFMSALSFLSLLAIGWFLIDNFHWFKGRILEVRDPRDPEYVTYAMHMQNSLLKRCVGLFSGFALLFVGSSVALYVAKRMTKLDGEMKDFKVSVTTASPGIIAMLIGGFILAYTIQSKDEFTTFVDDDSPAATSTLTPGSGFPDFNPDPTDTTNTTMP